MRAADLIIECLKGQGAERLFCVPGESYLALLDALHGEAGIDVVVCRHEGGAALMAVADAKLSGHPGLAAVSRGPGAMNAAIAVHVAEQDAVPLVLLVGQVARHERGRDAFQEVDYVKAFGGMAKGVWEVHEASRLPEVIARAYHMAATATPGPVVIVLPEDVLEDETDAAVWPAMPVAKAAPGEADVSRVAELLEKAERPLIIAGGALDGEEGRRNLARAAEAHHVPVALTFKHQEIFDNSSALFGGYLGFKIPRPQVDKMAESDLVIAVGTRLGDTPTQNYTFPRAPKPDQPLVHVYPDASKIGGVFRTDIGIACDPAAFLEALAARNAAVTDARRDWAKRLHKAAADLANGYEPQDNGDGVDFGAVVLALAKKAPKDAIITLDAGNFSSWVHRVWPWDGTQLTVGAVGGAMGLAVPGAVAAGLRFPDRPVLAFLGDGGSLMTGNELATAIARGLSPKIFISNNNSYATIRLHQERDYPRRPSGTDLVNPDFAAWARSFGAEGLTIADARDVDDVVAKALAAKGPVVVDVKASLEAISAYTTMSKLRGAA